MRRQRLLIRLFVVAGFLAIWEGVFQLGVISPIIFGAPSLLIAAALTWRGRGRIVGPLRPDLLIRFGVSTWR